MSLISRHRFLKKPCHELSSAVFLYQSNDLEKLKHRRFVSCIANASVRKSVPRFALSWQNPHVLAEKLAHGENIVNPYATSGKVNKKRGGATLQTERAHLAALGIGHKNWQ